MANYCPYCRGIIGVDCFNVAECGSISQQMIANASEDQQDSDAALTLIRQMLEATKDADHLCKWLLQSDISEADRERVIRENGVSFAVQIAAAEKFLEGR